MRKTIYNFLYLLLLSPVLAYIYAEWLKLPKNILHFYVFIFFAIGFIFIVIKRNIHYPKYLWYLFFYASYRFIWLQIADIDMHPLTFIYYCIINYVILFVIVIIYNTHFTDKFINRSIKIIKITVILAAIASVIQIFNTDFLNAWDYISKREMEGSLYTFRRASIFGYIEPNELGLSYLPLASVLISFLLFNKSRIFIFYTILIGLTALLSNGRYIMGGFIILTIQFLVFYKVKLKGLLRYIFYIAVAGFILFHSLKYLGYNYSSWYQERLFAEGEISNSTRYGAFLTFAEFFPQKPIFGTGVHLTKEIEKASREIHSSQIHVGYLSHLVSYGLVGSFLLFGFWFMLAKRLYKTAKKTKYWGSFFAFLIYFWAQAALVNYSIFFTGLIFALVFDKYHYDKLKFESINTQKDQKRLHLIE